MPSHSPRNSHTPSPRVRRSGSRSYSPSPRNNRRSISRSRSRSNERERRSSSPSEVGYRVYVGDLGLNPSQSEIEHAFKKIGQVMEVWLARNPPCFAFIVYKHESDAEEAVRTLDGTSMCGSRVRCSIAKPRRRGGRGVSGGWDPDVRCYQCGGRGHFARNCRTDWETSRGYRRSRSRSPNKYRERERHDRNHDRYNDRYNDRGGRDYDRGRERGYDRNDRRSPRNNSSREYY